MKRFWNLFFISVFVISLFISHLPGSIGAQEEIDAFDTAHREYLVAQENYQRAHLDYVTSKTQYQNFKTLASEEQLIQKTRSMLSERDEVVIQYLEAVHQKLQAPIGVSDIEIDLLQVALNSHLAWFSEHKNNLSSASTLSDLQRDSNLAKNQFALIEAFTYETFTVLSMGRIADFEERIIEIQSALQDKVGGIRNETRDEFKFSDEKLLLIDRWLQESNNKIDRGIDERNRIQDQLQNKTPKHSATTYTSSVASLTQVQNYYNEAASYMKEIVREIKTKN